jgi:hypothetical protein
MRWLSKSEARIVSAILVVAILLGSFPLSTGLAIGSHPKRPTLTLNVCEPLQAALNLSGIPMARPATRSPRLILVEHGRSQPSLAKPLSDLSIAPETPPPKARV